MATPVPASAARASLVPRPVVLTTFVLALLGLADALYLSVAHYTTSAILACSGSGVIDCARVTTSSQSRVFGLPVALLGALYYLVAVALFSPPAWRARHRVVHVARLVASIGAMVFVLWLVYAEVVILGSICLYCTGVHLVTFALFVFSVHYGPRLVANRRLE